MSRYNNIETIQYLVQGLLCEECFYLSLLLLTNKVTKLYMIDLL